MPQFYLKRYFQKRKKNLKKWYGFWTINKFEIKESYLFIYYLIIYWKLIFFTNYLITIPHYYYKCKINILDIFEMDDFFQIFFISQGTEILVKSIFLLWVYVSYILNKFEIVN